MEIKTATKIKEYYLGLLSDLRIYFAISVTTIIKSMLEIDDTRDAPTCMIFE